MIRPHFYDASGYGLKRLAPAAGASWRTLGASEATTLDWVEKARG